MRRFFDNLQGIFSRRKPFQAYSHRQVQFMLEKDGKVDYCQWLHPGEHVKVVDQGSVDFFRQFVAPGDFVIDIGAHEGDTSVPMAIAAGRDGLTLAIEANPHVFQVLSANANLNKEKTNIVAENFAVTADDGVFHLGSGDPSFGNGGVVGFTHNQPRNVRYQMEVPGKNLERFVKSQFSSAQVARLSFVKIDTEGYDKEIIKSIKGLIDAYHPVIIAEVFGPSTTEERFELYDLMAAGNAAVYRFDHFVPGNILPLTKKEIVGRRTYNILSVPPVRIPSTHILPATQETKA